MGLKRRFLLHLFYGVALFRSVVSEHLVDECPEQPRTENVKGAVSPKNVFIFGDSVTRQAVGDFCRSKSNALGYEWGENVFKDKTGAHASAVCIFHDTKVAFLHLYGSNETGPYLHGHVNTASDPYTDTPLRVCKSFEVYKNQEGVPTHVVWAVSWWDIMANKNYRTGNKTWVSAWGKIVRRRLFGDVHGCFPDSKIVVATVPHSKYGGQLMIDMNTELRRIAREQSVPLWDFDDIVWSNGKSEEILFRDRQHPSISMGTRGIESLLNATATGGSRSLACKIPVRLNGHGLCAAYSVLDEDGVPVRSYAVVNTFCNRFDFRPQECFQIFKTVEMLRTQVSLSSARSLLGIQLVTFMKIDEGEVSRGSMTLFPFSCNQYFQEAAASQCRIFGWSVASLLCVLFQEEVRKVCMSSPDRKQVKFAGIRVSYKIYYSKIGKGHLELDLMAPMHSLVSHICTDPKLGAIANVSSHRCHNNVLQYASALLVVFSNIDSNEGFYGVNGSSRRFPKILNIFDGEYLPVKKSAVWDVLEWSRRDREHISKIAGDMIQEYSNLFADLEDGNYHSTLTLLLKFIVAYKQGGVFLLENLERNITDKMLIKLSKTVKVRNGTIEPIICTSRQDDGASVRPSVCITMPGQSLWLNLIRSVLVSLDIKAQPQGGILAKTMQVLEMLMKDHVFLPLNDSVRMLPVFANPLERDRIIVIAKQEQAGLLHLLLRSMDNYLLNWRRQQTFVLVVMTRTALSDIETRAFEIVRITFPLLVMRFFGSAGHLQAELGSTQSKSWTLPANAVFIRHTILAVEAGDVVQSDHPGEEAGTHETDAKSTQVKKWIDEGNVVVMDGEIASRYELDRATIELVRARQLKPPRVDSRQRLSLEYEALECTSCLLKPYLFPKLSRLRKAMVISNKNNRMHMSYREIYHMNIMNILLDPENASKLPCVSVTGRKFTCPTKVKLAAREHPYSGTTLFTPQTMVFDYVVEQFGGTHQSSRIAWFDESRPIGESIQMERIGRVNEFSKINQTEYLFDVILTHDERLVKRGLPFAYIVFGGLWVNRNNYPGVLTKNSKPKLVSMMSSRKQFCNLHRQRLLVAYYFQNHTEYNVDVYGLTGTVPPDSALKNYMFTIVFENDIQSGFFTEKLLNAFASFTVPIYVGGFDSKRFPYFSKHGIIRSDGTVEDLQRIIGSLSHDSYLLYMKYGGVENSWRAQRFRSREDIVMWKIHTLINPVLRARWQLVNAIASRFSYGSIIDILCGTCNANPEFLPSVANQIDGHLRVFQASGESASSRLEVVGGKKVDIVFLRQSNLSLEALRSLVSNALRVLANDGMLIMEGTDPKGHNPGAQLLTEMICNCVHAPLLPEKPWCRKRLSINTIHGCHNGHDCLESGVTLVQFGYATTRALSKRGREFMCNENYQHSKENALIARRFRRNIGELISLHRFHEMFLY